MIKWLVVAETWFNVDERSNETVDLGKLVSEIEQRSSTGWQQWAAEMIHREAGFSLCLSTQKCSSWEWRSLVCKARQNESTNTEVPNQKETLEH
jgi:hypothetical protein